LAGGNRCMGFASLEYSPPYKATSDDRICIDIYTSRYESSIRHAQVGYGFNNDIREDSTESIGFQHQLRRRAVISNGFSFGPVLALDMRECRSSPGGIIDHQPQLAHQLSIPPLPTAASTWRASSTTSSSATLRASCEDTATPCSLGKTTAIWCNARQLMVRPPTAFCSQHI
jgi:hypothetical protein